MLKFVYLLGENQLKDKDDFWKQTVRDPENKQTRELMKIMPVIWEWERDWRGKIK